IMVSSVYQQSSAENPAAAQTDPSNQLLWRMNRHRLDFEAMRNTFLALSGKIDSSIGGRPVDITTEPFTGRRTVYGFVERQNLPGVFRTFDFASPDATSPQRFTTTVPQQALFLMNSPFAVQQARGLAERAEIKSCASAEERVRRLYALAYQRPPDPEELKLALRFVEARSKEPSILPEAPSWQCGYGELDEAAKRVNAFHPLPHYT